MEIKPILTFNQPKGDGKRRKFQGGGRTPRTPSIHEQAVRIIPKVENLEKRFAENILLADTPEGMQPEKVLVLEIAGDVQNLTEALSKVQGFEVLSQSIVDREFRDENFFYEQKGEQKAVVKNAYLAMSNQAGLHRLLTMWRRFVESGRIDYGYAPLKQAFLQCADIRFWDTQDRLETTYILEDWQYRVEDSIQGYDEPISFEIELWYRPTVAERGEAEAHVRNIIADCEGSVSKSFVHEGISYHALLGKLPVSRVRQVVESSGTALELMRCDEVMFFRPLGQCITPKLNGNEEQFVSDSEQFELPEHDAIPPIIALLDGLPLSNHEALAGRITIDDPDDFESLYNAPSEQVHGTSMASLIIHGDLNRRDEPSLKRPLYVRPILAPGREQPDGARIEQIPPDHLPIDLVHRAVVRMKVGDDGLPPTAPEVVTQVSGFKNSRNYSLSY